MARLFDDGSNQYLDNGNAVLSAAPLAVSCWFNIDDLTIRCGLVSIGDTAGALNYFLLYLDGVVQDRLRLQVREGATIANAIATAPYTSGTWQHALGISAAADDHRVLLDGGSKGTDATSTAPAGLDNTAIGAQEINSVLYYMSGAIAEVAVWDLTNWPGATAGDKADEFERLALPALADGYSPLFFPLGLVAYWPLGGVYDANDGDRCIVNRTYDQTPQNGPSTADHPAIVYPSQPIVVHSVAAAGLSIPIAMHHYKQLMGAC